MKIQIRCAFNVSGKKGGIIIKSSNYLKRIVFFKIPVRFTILTISVILLSLCKNLAVYIRQTALGKMDMLDMFGEKPRIVAGIFFLISCIAIYLLAKVGRHRAHSVRSARICSISAYGLLLILLGVLFFCGGQEICIRLFSITLTLHTFSSAIAPDHLLAFAIAYHCVNLLIIFFEYSISKTIYKIGTSIAGSSWEDMQDQELEAVRKELGIFSSYGNNKTTSEYRLNSRS